MAKKVLIIDDSLPIIDALTLLLEAEGYETDTSSTGEDGVNKAKSKKPDLVITDTVLPGIDGFETCRRIREIYGPKNPKIIIMTGNIDAIDAVRAREMGADDYSVKTLDFAYLMEAVKKLK